MAPEEELRDKKMTQWLEMIASTVGETNKNYESNKRDSSENN